MRARIFLFTIGASLILLVAGLFYMQIVKGAYYKERSERNRIVVVPLDAPRGKIYDKNGVVIVDNRISFDVSVIYNDARDINELAMFLSDRLSMDQEYLKKNITRAKWRPYAPTLLAEDIGKINAIILEQERIDHPGLIISTRPKREYVYGASAAAITGYLGKINKDELTRFKTYGYTVLDLIGRSGLEQKFDDYLRGNQGGMQVETNSRGRQERVLYVRKPELGKSVYTTIDIDLQNYCYLLMEGKRGSIIVMDPDDGKVFALISTPSFDPNVFVRKGSNRQIRKILRNLKGDYPMLNRGISCAYPPGSIFKILVGLGALDSGKFSDDMEYDCHGYITLGKSVFRCWRANGHGIQWMDEAIQNSCNVFFYRLGMHIGVKDIFLYAGKFGLGRPTGIDLPGEIAGLLPSPRWKADNFGESWYLGDTVNYSIGQGFLLATPIQIVRMMSAVANGGYLVKPYIVKRVGNVEFSSSAIERIGISRDALIPVKKGLVKVVNDVDGTGRRARLEGVVIAGKTGTSQSPQGKTHGWFSCYAPEKNPRICVVVFVEHGGKGGVGASMIAHNILKKSTDLGIL